MSTSILRRMFRVAGTSKIPAILVFFATIVFCLAILSERLWSKLAALDVLTPKLSSVSALVVTFIGFVFVAFSQNSNSATHVKNYRWLELELVRQGKLSEEAIVEYHRGYNWSSYAGLGFSSLFIATPLFFGSENTAVANLPIILVGLALLAASTIIHGTIDFVHLNSMSPLIPIEKRFEIIEKTLFYGGSAMMLQICAAGVFLSLLSPALALFSTVIAITMAIVAARLRPIPLEAIKQHFELSDSEIKSALDAAKKKRFE